MVKIMEIKTAIVAGTGKSGISATKLLINHGVSVYLFDENKDRDIDKIKESVDNSELVNVVLGELSEEALSASQLMVISPGIPVDAPFTDIVRNAGIPIWSEIELAYHYGKGKIAAITGTNGTGKTTIVDLILRLHSPTKGEILLDNINVKEIDKNSYLKEISVLNQESYLFNLSIRENFNLVERDTKKQEEMCKLTGIDKFIKTLPKGYDTIIDENSHNISGGQKRLLSLTRTLLKDAKILIFDEATSSLDTDKIQNVINILNELKKNHTVIVITHKEEIENIADEVITINDGKVKIKTSRVSDITVKNY